MRKLQTLKVPLLKVCSLLLLLFFVTSCEQDQELEQIPATIKSVIPEADLQTIKELGFDTSDIIVYEDHYVVDGCIMLFKDKLSEYEKTDSSLRHAHYGSLISLGNQRNITVGIAKDRLPIEWTNSIIDAVIAWNRTGSNIDMIFTGLENADILIVGDPYIKTVAEAAFPYQGKVGRGIMVNSTEHYNKYYSAQQKQYIIAHELGHCLGLRHTDWEKHGESQAIDIPIYGASNDMSSVMNKFYDGSPWYNFTYHDLQAIRWIYPNQDPFCFVNSRPLFPSMISAKPGQSLNVLLDFTNIGRSNFRGVFTPALTDYMGNISYVLDDYLATTSTVIGPQVNPSYYRACTVPANARPGTYYLRFMYKEDGSNQWKFISKGYGPFHYNFTVL